MIAAHRFLSSSSPSDADAARQTVFPSTPLAPTTTTPTEGAALPWGAALGLPLLVGILLAGRGGGWDGRGNPSRS